MDLIKELGDMAYLKEIEITNIDATKEQMDTLPGHKEARELLKALAQTFLDGARHVSYDMSIKGWKFKVSIDVQKEEE